MGTESRISTADFFDRFSPSGFSGSQIPNPKICPTCSGQNFWRSVYGGEHCLSCQPPIDESQVAESADSSFPSRLEVRRQPQDEPQPPQLARDGLWLMPRGIEWPDAVYRLPWPDGELPEWLFWRVESRHAENRSFSSGNQKSKSESTFSEVIRFRPGWIPWPGPNWPCPGGSWRPSELPACWYCGFTLFWRDSLSDERCGICSPPVGADHVAGWFLKEGPAFVV